MDDYEKERMLTVRHKKLIELMKIVYGYDSFRPRQFEVINRLIRKEDVCAIFPTGFGKSICFQIPAIYIDKPAIVISPLISLMNDQRMILEEKGISSCCYNNEVKDKKKLMKEILNGKHKFIYSTPESIINIQDFLVELNNGPGISLIAIDEAHCITSYGRDFRAKYRQLTFFKDLLPGVPILAVTATATTAVAQDICKVLGFNSDIQPIKTSFDRPNLYLDVSQKSKKIDDDIIPIIRKHPNEAIIIYCLRKKETVKVSKILNQYKIKNGIYHADIPKESKEKTHEDFLKGKLNVVVATIAFGMGINKSNVRVIIHYGSPKNIEGYYQEIGRAGRDGIDSFCYTFFSRSDFAFQESLIDKNNNRDGKYVIIQKNLLNMIKKYMFLKTCRRKFLLEYFEERAKNKCNKCDNCCETKKSKEIVTVKQNINNEAKMLIDMTESFGDRSYGKTILINILRGSKNKSITTSMKSTKYYNKGSHRSTEWWIELVDKLINMGYLQYIVVKRGFPVIYVLKATHKGAQWSNRVELGSILNEVIDEDIQPIEMNATV